MTTKVRLTYYGMDGEGRTVKEAKADAGRKLEALVKQKDTEPRMVTIGNSAAIYWHDQSGWRVALAVINGKPQTRLCAGYPGEASEDEAMSKAASWAAETEWNQECKDDQAFFCDAVARFVGKRDLSHVVAGLVSKAAWQRAFAAYTKQGFTNNEAHALASGYACEELRSKASVSAGNT